MKAYAKKAIALFISVVMIITALIMPNTVFAAKSTKKNYVDGEVIAVLQNSATSKYTTASSAKSAYGSKYSLDDSYTFGDSENGVKVAVLKSGSLTTKQMIKNLKSNPAVKYALPNYKVKATSITNDTYSDYQWALSNTGQNGGTPNLDTNPETLWDNAKSSKEEQVVAIVDTGIDPEHPELKDKLWSNPYGKKLLGKHGLDFTNTIDDGTPFDDNGHGTHCAGIIAAQADNNQGVSGINKANVKIMALKFLDESGSGSTADALAAYEYIQRAVELGTNVVACNNSWGGLGDENERMLFDSIYDELGKLGVISFVAAGNESSNLDETVYDFFDDETYCALPACCNSEYCITVAASNEKDELADFSNFSTQYVDVAAPGANILSTVSYDCFNPTVYSQAQKDQLCAEYQDYNAAIDDTSFGYPKKVEIKSEDYSEGTKTEISQDVGFGLDSQSLKIKFNDITESEDENDDDEDGVKYYAFEMPFTLDDADKNYSVSIMGKLSANASCYVYDVPASKSVKSILDKESSIYLWGTKIDNFWEHKYYDIDMEEVSDSEDYTKAKDRKLVFLVEVAEAGAQFTIDDLAISSQDADKSSFGKYDFYCGTSMATPYATGAAALIKNADSTATAEDIINIIKNAGRHSDNLEDKTETAKVLSLDNVNAVPPLITNVSYNKNGDVEIQGSFREISSVMINGEEVNPKSITNSLITVRDNNYSTKRLDVTVSNPTGDDFFFTMLSKKPSYATVSVNKVPDVLDGFAVPTRDKAYFVSGQGEIGYASYNASNNQYSYKDVAKLDVKKIFSDSNSYNVTGAVLLGNKMYVTVLSVIKSEFTDKILGYNSAIGCVDLINKTTTYLAELPEEIAMGSSLALYNNEIYLLGGYSIDTNEFLSDVYKFNASNNSFAKTSYALPEGRAFTSFIQYNDKLVGVGGANEYYMAPDIISFDGSSWTTFPQIFDSDDSVSYYIGSYNSLQIYPANLGYGENGIFVCGSFIYDIGDTYIINPDSRSVTAVNACVRKSFEDNQVIGTTVQGSFIGFEVQQKEESSEVSVGIRSLNAAKSSTTYASTSNSQPTAFAIKLNNRYDRLATGHILSETPATAATYTSKGNNAYYYCSICGKYFSDAQATKETTPEAEVLAVLPKKANTLKVKAKKPTVKYAKLRKKKQTIARKKALTVSNAKGTVSYKKTKGNKSITVNKKNGKITVKKGLKKGSYKVKIKVTAAGNTEYKSASKTVTVTVRIK
ncbi:MAG: S8 family serine peptidase [Eubacterium sp.]|nr:S8 family serine peptidase [Eubacterium sp.]